MSDVPALAERIVVPRMREAGFTPEQLELLRAVDLRIEAALRELVLLGTIVNREIDTGYPDDGTGAQRIANIRGSWVTVAITDQNQFGAGAGAPVTFTHNLNLPVLPVPTQAYNLPNVTWELRRIVHGDRTGANAAPAAVVNAAHVDVHFRLGDAVAANSIQLRVHSGIIPSATEPLTLDLFFSPAVI